MGGGGGFKGMKENKKATKKNQNPLTSSLFPASAYLPEPLRPRGREDSALCNPTRWWRLLISAPE